MTSTIVIGSGFAGLTAALFCAERGQKVTLLTHGAGTLPLNSGVIDVLGYDETRVRVVSPREGLKKLSANHPYNKIGIATVEKAITHFLATAEKYGFPYCGNLDKQIDVPTPAGTLKPTCLSPKSLDATDVSGKVTVVVVKELKDFYGEIIAANLKKFLPQTTDYNIVTFDSGLTGGRDITTLDVARLLDTKEGRDRFIAQMLPHAKDTTFITPQILGATNGECAEYIESKLNTRVIETTCLPPSVNGLRLRNMLLGALQSLKVKIVEDTTVLRAERQNGKCIAVVAKTAAREKRYTADRFILATGGIYSGGVILPKFEEPKEPIFDLPVWFIPGEENHSNEEFFSDKPQGFAQMGIMTDENLLPVDKNGNRILDNVYIVGRNLAGFDFCFEHSGNGVALSSAYKVATI